ncbi:hypothetical protein F3J44_09580 [Pantoea sp. Tr-811]|uniref:DUF6708 domain-containing protein n=1 Tax=Pantoea sp. Tr-811 TaxID=2608361 RepID=UPI00141E14FD|nr:DUF6708 domain-containing protein [Pantoea sp. Tr-811]NIF26637.1 hypothetical protein [Pantoea sp. Tr-811]
MTAIKKLPKNLRFGGKKLYHGTQQPSLPDSDGVHRINDKCIEINTYANIVRSGSAGFIGVSILASIIISIMITLVLGTDTETLLAILMASPSLPLFSIVFYFASGAHRYRGSYIRINRNTRKLYFIHPNNPNYMHVIDWDSIEGLAGFIPIVTSHGYTTRHPLYLFGTDYAMTPPTEIFAACGNSGALDGGQSAQSLWAYLQHYMTHGAKDLPSPPNQTATVSRRDATLQPYREWADDFRKQLCKKHGWLWAPFTIPEYIFLLLFHAYPNSVEAWIQYNVPFVKFPREIDVICGFAEKRKPVIRVNGVKLDQ